MIWKKAAKRHHATTLDGRLTYTYMQLPPLLSVLLLLLLLLVLFTDV